jgi:hypothetical protein
MMNPQKLREIFSACNFGELSDEEFDIMCRVCSASSFLLPGLMISPLIDV